MQAIKKFIADAVRDAIRGEVQAGLDKQTRAIIACFQAYTARLEQVEETLIRQTDIIGQLIEAIGYQREAIAKLADNMRADADPADWWKG